MGRGDRSQEGIWEGVDVPVCEVLSNVPLRSHLDVLITLEGQE